MSEPLVSVVIPIFNHEPFLIECLESIKRDRYERIEIIAIDDGSSDQSYDVASAWLDSNQYRFEAVKISRQPNAGIPTTFNRLVHQSKGEFIFPLASDDQVANGGIYNLLQFYEQHCDEPTLLISNAELIDWNGDLVHESSADFYGKDEWLLERCNQFLAVEILLRWGSPFQHHFYPRTLYESVGGYDESLKYEDLYFALKNIARGSAAYSSVISKRYRLRPGLALTPGITVNERSRLPIRRAVAQDFTFWYRVLLTLLNASENKKYKIRRKLSLIVLAIIRKIVMIYSHLLSKVVFRP